MRKLLLLMVMSAMLAMLVGCASPESGSREYVPGQGWVPAK